MVFLSDYTSTTETCSAVPKKNKSNSRMSGFWTRSASLGKRYSAVRRFSVLNLARNATPTIRSSRLCLF